MKAQKDTLTTHHPLCSKINLLVSELKNLIKGIEKEYPSSINSRDFKTLDNFYLAFEKNIATLYQLLDDIKYEGQKSTDTDYVTEAYKKFSKIVKQVMLIKESFYLVRQEMVVS